MLEGRKEQWRTRVAVYATASVPALARPTPSYEAQNLHNAVSLSAIHAQCSLAGCAPRLIHVLGRPTAGGLGAKVR